MEQWPGHEQRGTIRPAGDYLQEGVQIRSGLTINLDDATPGLQPIPRGRRTIGKERHIHALRYHTALRAHRAMRRMQRGAGPLHHPIKVTAGQHGSWYFQGQLTLAAPDGDGNLGAVDHRALHIAVETR